MGLFVGKVKWTYRKVISQASARQWKCSVPASSQSAEGHLSFGPSCARYRCQRSWSNKEPWCPMGCIGQEAGAAVASWLRSIAPVPPVELSPAPPPLSVANKNHSGVSLNQKNNIKKPKEIQVIAIWRFLTNDIFNRLKLL